MISHIILAAGKGTRMRSKLPKVLQLLADKPILHHIVDASSNAGAKQQLIVYGHGGELVQESFANSDYKDSLTWVHQSEQNGTGHATQCALPYITGDKVVVLVGDALLIQADTLKNLAGQCPENGMSLLTAIAPNPTGLGRIIRNEHGGVLEIVEHKDASNEQLKIAEINTGIMCFDKAILEEFLPKIKSNNSQAEYYLTDLIAMCVENGKTVQAVIANFDETMGVNNKAQLAQAERIYQNRQVQKLMEQGCTVVDPARVDIRGNVTIGQDVFIDANVIFEGHVILDDDVHIETNCILKDCTVGAGTRIHAFSHIDDSVIADNCVIGPYARLRPGANLHKGSKAGNFVEIKKSVIGEGSKINHLTYIGDAEIGENVNVGAGTITCNYDGVNKFKTEIADGAFIGSNSSLVAPVRIGERATTAAGSTITENIPDTGLGIGRGRQVNKENWKK